MAVHPRNAHGAHVRAHVLYEGGEDVAGLAYLDEWLKDYPATAQLHCHLTWHVAIFALGVGRLDRAWQVYAGGVAPGASWGPPVNTLTDAASFLWRAELAGSPRDASALVGGARLCGAGLPEAGRDVLRRPLGGGPMPRRGTPRRWQDCRER
jgi:hypothetical protein